MFLRALFLSSAVGATAAFATAPWMLMISLGLAGLFSGFNPAAIALVSVSVPESKLNRSLSLLAGAQYIGTMIGPAVGAVLALGLDYRYVILVTAIVPMISGVFVLFMVPTDRVVLTQAQKDDSKKVQLEPFHMSFQFLLAIFMYFMIFALNQLTRIIAPIALRTIEGHGDVAGHSGIAFSLAGLVSAIGVLAVAPVLFKTGRMAPALAASCVVGGLGFLVMASAGSSALYIGGFLIVAMVLSAMTPSTNTLIAANVTRSRRGTAFGVAGQRAGVGVVRRAGCSGGVCGCVAWCGLRCVVVAVAGAGAAAVPIAQGAGVRVLGSGGNGSGAERLGLGRLVAVSASQEKNELTARKKMPIS